MVGECGIRYDVHIITNHFGDLVAKVCECLLRRGPLTRQNINRYAELSDEQVKNALLVLIQQNCVQAFSTEQPGSFGDAPKVNTQYVVLFDNILDRMRFAKFLTVVSWEFDKQCEEVLQGLLEHGRLTLEQMFDRAKSTEKEETFLKLVIACYVECCRAPESLLMPMNEEENPARKRGPNSAKKNEESETIVQVLAAAVPMESMRFSVITNMESDSGGEGKENNSNSTTLGEKRKHDVLESDECGATDEESVLYRANFEEFIHRLRHKGCIDNVRACLDDGAANVLSAMLEATRSAEKKVKTKNSVPLSLSSIYEEVIKNEAGCNMTLDRARASLLQLGQPPFVKGSSDSYCIEFEKIIEVAQNDEVESIVLKRYGREAYRMFRLLPKAGHLLETNKNHIITAYWLKQVASEAIFEANQFSFILSVCVEK